MIVKSDFEQKLADFQRETLLWVAQLAWDMQAKEGSSEIGDALVNLAESCGRGK